MIEGVAVSWKYGDLEVPGINTFKACQAWCFGNSDCGSVYFAKAKNQCWKFNRQRTCGSLFPNGVDVVARKKGACGEQVFLGLFIFVCLVVETSWQSNLSVASAT